MGACSSKKAREEQLARDIDKNMVEAQKAEQNTSKLLLLGAGESGKSTLFKQMMVIYGSGFQTEEDCLPFKPIIHNNIVTSMKTLVKAAAQHADGAVIACQEAKQVVETCSDDQTIDSKLGNYISQLWKDTAIQTTFENRCHFQLTDSAAYFFERIDEVYQPGWLPTQDNVMRARVRTTGIVENDFVIDSNLFKMYDVGGQRNERKKWIHCFEGVTAVLFVGVLSEYNLRLYEDDTMNRMEETLNLFDEIINSRWFHETHVILFLNKRDVFAEKIEKYPLTECCPLFNADCDGFDAESINTYDGGCKAIKDLFMSKNTQSSKNIYTHITCATDTDNTKVVFEAVKDIVIRASLNEAGLV